MFEIRNERVTLDPCPVPGFVFQCYLLWDRTQAPNPSAQISASVILPKSVGELCRCWQLCW